MYLAVVLLGLCTHLIVHEGQERRDDQRETGASLGVEQRRELVAQGLAGTGGQHQQCGHAWTGARSAVRLCSLASAPPHSPGSHAHQTGFA